MGYGVNRLWKWCFFPVKPHGLWEWNACVFKKTDDIRCDWRLNATVFYKGIIENPVIIKDKDIVKHMFNVSV